MMALRRCKELGGIKGTEEEVAFIMKIMVDTPNKDHNKEFYKEAQTKEPETLAVRLYAATLLVEQKEKNLNSPSFSRETKNPTTNNECYVHYLKDKVTDFYDDETFVTCVDDIYRSYHQVKSAVPEAMQLNTSDSLSLLRKINPQDTTLKNELNTFELLHYKDLRKALQKKQKQGKMLNPTETKRLNECEKQIDALRSFERCKEYINEVTEEIAPPKDGRCKRA